MSDHVNLPEGAAFHRSRDSPMGGSGSIPCSARSFSFPQGLDRLWGRPTPPPMTPWPESVSELYRPSDRHLSAKLVPTFADRGCHVVSVTNLYGRILGFLDRNCSDVLYPVVVCKSSMLHTTT
jgi:hypothetical protein